MPGKLRCPCLRPKQNDVFVLDYRHSQLQYVPSDVFSNERTLEELLIDSNDIQELPKELFLCHCLRKLSASSNDLVKVPVAIENLVYLEYLDLSNNGIIEIADSFRHLKNLNYVDISVNPLGRLPDGFSQLLNLKELYLNTALLDFLPGSFGRLSRLQVLELRENRLSMLPSSMSQLTLLQRLDIGNNDLVELPEWLGNLTSLQELWLDTNNIGELPPCLGRLQQLLFLDASKNQLQFVSPDLGHCRALSDLHLSLNRLEHLPEQIGGLVNLTTLKIDDNKIAYLPLNIGNLLSLSELHMNINEVQDLPPTIGFLRHLRVLYADENLLSELPPEIGSCCGLTVLSLSSNKMTYLPEELGRALHLRVLNLSDNKLDNLPYSLTRLKELQALWLARNQAKPIVPLQADTDGLTGHRVLTCYLLPQRPLMEPEAGDDENFNQSEWEEELQQRRTIQFDFGPLGEPTSRLQRQPTPYPKEMKHRAQYVRNLAMKEVMQASATPHKVEGRSSPKKSRATGTSTESGSKSQKQKQKKQEPQLVVRDLDEAELAARGLVKKSLSQGLIGPDHRRFNQSQAPNLHSKSYGSLPAPPQYFPQSQHSIHQYGPYQQPMGYFPPHAHPQVLAPHQLYQPFPGTMPVHMVPLPQEFSQPRRRSGHRASSDYTGYGRGYESDTGYRQQAARVKGRSEGYSSDMEAVRVVGRREARRTEGYSSDAESAKVRLRSSTRPSSHVGYSSDVEGSKPGAQGYYSDVEGGRIPSGRHPWHVLYGLKTAAQSNYYDPSVASEPAVGEDQNTLRRQRARNSIKEEVVKGEGSGSDDADYKSQIQNASMRIHQAQSPQQSRIQDRFRDVVQSPQQSQIQTSPMTSTPTRSTRMSQSSDLAGFGQLDTAADPAVASPAMSEAAVASPAMSERTDSHTSVSQHPVHNTSITVAHVMPNSPYQRRYPQGQPQPNVAMTPPAVAKQPDGAKLNHSLVANQGSSPASSQNSSRPGASPRGGAAAAPPNYCTPPRYPWKMAAAKTSAYDHDVALFKEQVPSQVSSSTDSGYVNSHPEKQLNSPGGSSSQTDQPTSSPNTSSQTIQISVKLVKNPGLGFSIAGGLHSTGNPFVPGDSGIFITRVNTDGPAAGKLRTADKILKMNDTSFERIEHAVAVETLRESTGEITLVVERRMPS